MTLISGPLSTVTADPTAVSVVQVSVQGPRTVGTGVQTHESKNVAVSGGVFSHEIAPGAATLTMIVGQQPGPTIPILVDDVESQTLAEVVDAARLATGYSAENLAQFVQQVLAARQDVLGAVAGFEQLEEDALTAIGEASTGVLAGIDDARAGALTDIEVEVTKAEDAADRAESAVNAGVGDGAVTIQKLAPDVKAQINGKADLVGGKVPTSQIPEVALTKPFSVTSRAALLALDAQEGDIGIITAGADKGSYMLGTGPANVFSSWVQLAVSADAPVTSVNGQTGTVVLNAANVGAAPTTHEHTMAQITDLPTVSTNSLNGHIVQRQTNGHIQVPTSPAVDTDASSKAYVDQKILETGVVVEWANAQKVTITASTLSAFTEGSQTGDTGLIAAWSGASDTKRVAFTKNVVCDKRTQASTLVSYAAGEVIPAGTAVQPATAGGTGPYTFTELGTALGTLLENYATADQLENIVNAVGAAMADVATTILGKNLYNPDTDLVGFYLITTGQPQALANYRLTDFIPVTPDEPYSMNVARHWAFFDADRNMIPESWAQNSVQQSTVAIAPAGAAYLRMSYAVGAWNPTNVQIEHGTVSTAWEPYQRLLDPAIVVSAEGSKLDPLHITRSGDVVTVTSDLGGKPIAQEITLSMGRNGVLNFSRVSYNNALVTTLNDDVTPIRTQQGTVGANHGLALLARWTTGHGKTTADIGSVWSDGTAEFTIIDVDPAGKLFMGKAPAVVNGASTVPNATPAADLTHVSGATNTSTIPRSGFAITDQLAPWIQRRRLVVDLDGTPVGDGSVRGRVLTMRETYEILDYGAVWAWVRANIGQRYTTAHHKAAVGVETSWEFHPGGKTRHRTALWEISPTTLGNTGFMQAIAIPGTVTRYLPGVGTVGGLNWDAGVNLASLTTNLKVTSTDLLDGVPPTVAVDTRSDIAFAMALSPWEGASKSATHLAATPTNLYDLRNTKKLYPNIIGSLNPGWGRVEVEGIRAYLTPSEATSVVTDADPLSAWVTLNQMVGQ